MNKKLKLNIKFDKTKTRAIASLAIASFLLAFSLFASKNFLQLYVYQQRVITAQNASILNINQDQQVVNNVVSSYKQFVNQPTNVIGGTSTGTSSTSGNNAKIILDALPQTYDFPALISSIQALLTVPGVTINSLTGTDNSLQLIASSAPSPIPISFSATSSYTGIQNLLSVIKRSVMPIDILSIGFTGTDAKLTASITAQTYYYNPPSGLITSTETIQ
jgi:hypothetical protein